MARGNHLGWLAACVLTALSSGCVQGAGDTYPGMAAQLLDGSLLDDRRITEITGATRLEPDRGTDAVVSTTRIPGVVILGVSRFEPRFRSRGIHFRFTDTCVRLADMVRQFGRPAFSTPLTDAAGSSHSWSAANRAGPTWLTFVARDGDGCGLYSTVTQQGR